MNAKRKIDSHKHLLAVVCVFSLFVLLASYLAQYVWKIEPCRLCKLQRLPYFLLATLPLWSVLNMRSEIIKISAICLFAISAILALYHLLVIGGVIRDFCAVKHNVESIENFMAVLDMHIPCSEANWRMFKLPMAGYNFFLSLGFIYLWSITPAKHDLR